MANATNPNPHRVSILIFRRDGGPNRTGRQTAQG
jgi:hypothetical protein